MSSDKFWVSRSLISLNPRQWEALCDGCGKCCVHRLEDADTGDVHFTNVGCRFLDSDSSRCLEYQRRLSLAPECVQVTPALINDHPNWLPESCAYRLLAENKPLPWWHPLVSGSPETVFESGHSVRGRIICELEIENLQDHIVDWIG